MVEKQKIICFKDSVLVRFRYCISKKEDVNKLPYWQNTRDTKHGYVIIFMYRSTTQVIKKTTCIIFIHKKTILLFCLEHKHACNNNKLPFCNFDYQTIFWACMLWLLVPPCIGW